MMRRLTFFLGMIVFLLAGCASKPAIIEHPAPQLTIDNSYFSGLGCFDDSSCLEEEMKQYSSAGVFYEPSNLLGGLVPALPLAVYRTTLFADSGEIPAVYVNRCMGSAYTRYLVYVDGGYQFIDSVEGMARLYAPITTANEALSYAIATTGNSAIYDLDEIKKIKFYNPPVEETFVIETDGSYLVHLFHTYLCGCGPHIVRSVDVTVHKDGTLQVSEPVDAYRDPQYDDLCVD